MKNRIFILTTLFIFFIAFVGKSQDYQYVYYLDESLGTVEKSKAVILGKGLKEDQLFRLDCFDSKGEKLLLSLHFSDSALTTLEGLFSSYHLNGKLEKQGDYLNGNEEGLWEKWDYRGNKIDSSIYKNGKEVIKARYIYFIDGGVAMYSLEDYTVDSSVRIDYTTKNRIARAVFFKGKKGIQKTYNNADIKIDSLLDKTEVEAEFPGGIKAWTDYLKKNLDGDTPSDRNSPAGIYQVIVRFIVSKDGSVSDVVAETNHGFGMEQEVIRILKNSPNWIPASQNGKIVNAYRRQPITFSVSAK